ncbi:epidermal differentiation-specific protein-like [Clarias gariepinus]|uniref:epidermal differentiation-specific protein-like n=1 Tax=Clarias gariepinus TaxID=13013 RepID=UPI00234DF328|nr:epidermal differentiation-specific protein-like [Clarias gariepinus]
MNKIIVYEHCNFQGLSKEFTSDVPNLCHKNFNDCISSVKVIGNPWVAYMHENFTGEPTVYEEGEYPSVYYNESFSSLALVREALDNPQITLYEHENYQGQSLVLNHETNLCYGTFNDKVSSHIVQRGAWVLYEHGDRGGHITVARAGRNVPDYGRFHDQLSHVRPLKAGRPSIKAKIEWDKKKEHVKSVMLDSVTGVNYGSEKQSFTTDISRVYSGSITASFKFSDSSQISWGTKFGMSGFGFVAEGTFNVTETSTMERGRSNTKTTSKSIKVTLPTNIPPHTKLTVNVVRKEVTIIVPVKLTITTGFTSKVEYGEYRCEDGNSIHAEFKEEKI